MGAVDTGNQLRATEGLDHRNRRGWRAIAWTFLLEVALVNSYLLQQRAPGPRRGPRIGPKGHGGSALLMILLLCTGRLGAQGSVSVLGIPQSLYHSIIMSIGVKGPLFWLSGAPGR